MSDPWPTAQLRCHSKCFSAVMKSAYQKIKIKINQLRVFGDEAYESQALE